MAQSTDYSKALFLFQSSQWGLWEIELRRLRDVGGVYKQADILTHESIGNDADNASEAKDLRHVVTLCVATTPEEIYNKIGKGNYRTQKAFFEKADEKVRRHVVSLVDKRIADAVALTAKLGIPVFFKPGPREFIEPSKEIGYNSEPISLHTYYKRTDEGLDYRLTIGNGVVPSQHKAVIISNNPSLFCIDNQLFHFDDGLNGNLIRPFIKNEWIHIPRRMENEYLRKMIVKIASKIDIEADGFDVDEQYPDVKASLSLERTISGDYHFSLSFDYNGKTFTEKSSREKSVTMVDDGEKVCFVCVNRNRAKENDIRRKLYDDLHLPHHGTVSAMLEWARANAESLKSMNITVVQLTTHKYYIGDVRITHDEKRLGDWFQMHIHLNFDNGISIPLMAMRQQLVNGEKEFLLPNGEWFVIPDEWLARFGSLAVFGRNDNNGGLSIHRSQKKVLKDLNLDRDVSEPDYPEDYSLPQGLNATLRKYQEEGYRWLLNNFYAHTGCCLSDDMGLGKTIQSIALILKYKEIADKASADNSADKSTPQSSELSLFSDEEMGMKNRVVAKPVLVLAPASVVHNWRNEIRKFAPSLRVQVYTGSIAERKMKRGFMDGYDVVVTTYATMRNDIDSLAQVEWGINIYDESQVFKNSGSQIYEAVNRLYAPCKIALSGTPMENNLRELWSLMSILNPSLLGDSREFRKNFINPINNNLKSKNTEILRELVKPYFLRRTKSEVLDSLPERQDEIIYCEMETEQAKLYVEMQSRTRNMLLEERKRGNSGHALSTITRLREVTCSPALIGENIPSGKLKVVFENLKELRGTSHKVLIFSDFVSLLNLVANDMKQRGWNYSMLTGDTRNRERAIDYFQKDPQCQFFLISIDAGGVGLNLTEADYVFLLDPWWNVNKEEQAISRAHRQGQRRSVFVYRFISKDTIEEGILKVQDRKQSLIDAVLSCLNKE